MKKTLIIIACFLLLAEVKGQDFGMDRTWDRGREMDFVKEAALAGLLEVELGRLASANASSSAVKDFASRMESEHSSANRQLQKVADKMVLSLPATLDRQQRTHIQTLEGKNGAEFDKSYMEMMISEHEKDIEDMEEAQRRASSSELKAWVDSMLPVLKKHLEQAEEIQKRL